MKNSLLTLNSSGKKLSLFYFFSLMIFLSYSCQKDSFSDMIPSKNQSIENHFFNPNANTFHVNEKTFKDGLRPTVLGEKRENAYTTQVMVQAWNNLGRDQISSLPTTDIYVKFCPSSLEEMKSLAESDIFLYDFPLEYKVIEMGDYYVEPGTENDEFRCFYAVTKPEDNIAKLNPEIIAELHIPENDLELEREALMITGNEDDEKMMCEEQDPDWPECACQDAPSDHYEDCMEALLNPEINIPTTGDAPLRTCQLGKPDQPGGRITVENTQGLGDDFTTENGNVIQVEGVRRVQVIMKDNWFSQDVTFTDDNGCFMIDDNYKRKAWMWIKFRSQRAKTIRYPVRENIVVNALPTLESLIFPVKHYVGKLEGPVFNNISFNMEAPSVVEISVTEDIALTNPVHRLWSTSTVNNGLNEFHDISADEGILPPPNGLDVFIDPHTRGGFAIMKNFVGTANIIQAISSSLDDDTTFGDILHISDDVELGLNAFGPNIFDVLTAALGLSQTVDLFIPDVNIGGNFLISDEQETIVYHEIGHASHFTNVGNEYWLKLISAEVMADGHGHACTPENIKGIIEICEGWAGHLEHYFTDVRYPTVSLSSASTTWKKALEETKNEDFDNVPVGIYLDLIDNSEILVSCDMGRQTCPGLGNLTSDNPLFHLNFNTEVHCDYVNDNVTNFSNELIFSLLNENISSVDDLQNTILTNPSTSGLNTSFDINNLFSSY